MINRTITLFLILSLLSSTISMALTSAPIYLSFGKETDDSKSKETKSDSNSGSKSNDEDKSKENNDNKEGDTSSTVVLHSGGEADNTSSTSTTPSKSTAHS